MLTCPKCKTTRHNDDIVITLEKATEPGREETTKTTVRTPIRTNYVVEEDLLIHTCGLCEHEWTEEVESEVALVGGDSAFAAFSHFDLDCNLGNTTELTAEEFWKRLHEPEPS